MPAATGFNMTALSMRLSGYRNGVSARHGEITRAMWHDLWPDVEQPLTSDHVDHERRPPADLDLAAGASAAGSLPAPDWRERMQEHDIWDAGSRHSR